MTEFDSAQCLRFILTQVAQLTGQVTPSPEVTFVEAGGDSFAAIMMTVAIEEQFGILVDILDIFQAASLAKLAEVVAGRQAGTSLPRNS